MVTMNMISYKDERLGFFADQRKLVQKRYDRLEKQIKPDEPYTSERREFLNDLGRELSFYNDVIEMLENGVIPKSDVEKIFEEIELFLNKAIDGWEKERKVAYNDRQIEMIDFRNGAFKYCLHEIAELKKKYSTK